MSNKHRDDNFRWNKGLRHIFVGVKFCGFFGGGHFPNDEDDENDELSLLFGKQYLKMIFLVLTHVIFTTTQLGRFCSYSHFTEGKGKQREVKEPGQGHSACKG